MKSLICLVGVIVFSTCGRVNNNGNASYQETKMSLEDQEKSRPKEFLTVTYKAWINLINETVIEGDIRNQATVAVFKDAVLNVNVYSKTDTYLGTRNFTVYEFIKPGRSVHFKFKMRQYDKVNVSIGDAKPVN